MSVTFCVSELVTWRPFGIQSQITLELYEVAYWIVVIVCAPTAIIAWLEPDPIADEVLSSVG